MAFTAADVKNLREMTGVGMLDCKKALAETDGDMDKAVELLREKGLAAAQKKAGRIAAEGMAYAEVFSDGAALVEVNAETDFVAKNAQFIEFVKDVCYVVGKWGPVDMDTLMTLPYRKTGMTVQQALQDKIMVIGENIKIRRFVRYDSGVSVAYNHMNGRIGVLLNMEVSAGLEENEKVQELGKDLAMQIAAMNPAYLDKSDVSQDTLDKEKEIQLAMMANDPKMAAKPEKVKEGIVMGKLGKYYEENCLMQQAFVKENKISVEKHVAEVAKEVGGEIKVKGFYRYERGEGLEKKQENFAEEIAKQLEKK
ncbi:MAG: translation elongation factor Ts [Bacillota bacterium]|nr:translation elongation factor Ts [Bacillota bacterium]